MPNKENIAAVAELTDKIKRANMLLVSEYKALTVVDFNDLRTVLRKHDAEVIVSKNTLTKIAANDLGITGLDEFLGGPITLLLAYGDAVATAKALEAFLRTAKNSVKLRGGLLGKDRIAAGDLERVASTPTREQSIARVLGSLNSPASSIASMLQGVARNMAYVLAQVGEGKANAQSAG